jgi:hypothetical protein
MMNLGARRRLGNKLTYRASGMFDIATYISAFASEIAAALPAKVYDPVAWLGLVGALVLGAAVSPRRGWAFALGWGLLCFAVLSLESVYFSSPARRGDSAALAFICVLGVVAGRWFSRRSAQHS